MPRDEATQLDQKAALKALAFLYGKADDIQAIGYLDILRHRLESLEQAQEWRPMVTAPKDGTEFLVRFATGAIYHIRRTRDNCHWETKTGSGGGPEGFIILGPAGNMVEWCELAAPTVKAGK